VVDLGEEEGPHLLVLLDNQERILYMVLVIMDMLVVALLVSLVPILQVVAVVLAEQGKLLQTVLVDMVGVVEHQPLDTVQRVQ
jgi:hypothetical protein